jgi:serine/threonine-protein kinase
VNILVSKNGEVKISDYGVARALREASASTTTTLAGHVAYMAPEQAESGPIDERADLFAVGILLWEMLCGRPLFHRGAQGATLMAVLHDPILPPSTIRGDIDRAWDALVARALERDPAERYQSAPELAAALGAISPRVACADELGALVTWAIGVADTSDAPTSTPSDDATRRIAGQ